MFSSQNLEHAPEIKELKNGSPISITSKLKDFNPFLDKSGLLRIGGHLISADLSYDAKHPIILPPYNHVTRLLIVHKHEKLLHSGPQLVVFSLQSRFWIPNVCNTVQHALKGCYTCYRTKAAGASQLKGQLPSCHIQTSLPLTHVGFDYGGPLTLKGDSQRSKVNFKCHIVLFVCIVMEAIHLVLVKDLSSEAFLAALKRFVARKGRPVCIRIQ